MAQAADKPTSTTESTTASTSQQQAKTAQTTTPPGTLFVVQKIRIDGLQRLPVDRVFSLLPIHKGDAVTSSSIAHAIQVLYQSGDFDNVTMKRDGNTLIVKVAERPSIAKVTIKGNKSISTDDLRKGLKKAGLLEGDVYKRSTLNGITGELQRQYVSQGRYAARVTTKVTPLPRNQVALTIKIYEGSAARIQQINIVGNKAFSDETLLEQFELKASHFTSFFTGDDKYSRQKLSGDLESLRSYYLDRGYARFAVDSVQVSVTPNREDVFITVNVNEGKQYKVGDVTLEGNLPIARSQLEPLLVMQTGQVYSQQTQTVTSNLLKHRLENAGYAFADVKAYTQINDDTDDVDVSFFVEPGKRVYVKRISFSGNNKTKDRVLRRELRQFEAAPANRALIKMSRRRLLRLGFFSKVDVKTQVVPGTDDQLNVNYDVEEQPSGSIGANVGYSDANGVVFGASVSQKNFMGSGDSVSFSIRRSDVSTKYSFSHYDPYYTPDGVSRGFGLHYSKIDYGDSDVSLNRYAADRMGGNVTYGYPISEFSRINFGFSLERIEIHYGEFVPQSIWNFLQVEGTNFNEFALHLGVSTSTLNNGVLPDRGWSQNTSLEIGTPAGSYSYYKLVFNAQKFFPISDNWVLRTKAKLGYGGGLGDNKDLPFFENFYAGGIGSVRGYQSYSLGPRSPSYAFVQCKLNNACVGATANPDPVGGNFLTELSAELIFPTPFAPDSNNIRTFFFFDAGNVFYSGESDSGLWVNPDKLKMSYGIGLTWLTAMGPLSFDLAKAVNPEDYDDTETFQFSLGGVF